MNYSHKKHLPLLLFIILILSFACNPNINPSDPRILPNISPYLSIFTNYMSYLKALPDNQIPIPIILEPQPPLTTPTTVSFSGFSPNQSDLNSTNPPTINLYAVRPNGCEGGIIQEESLGSVTFTSTSDNSLESRKWTIDNVELITETLFVAATITIDGKEGPYSEVLVINPISVMPVVISPNQAYQTTPKISISGNALPGLCLSIFRNDSLVKDISIPYSKDQSITFITWSTGTKSDQLIIINEDSSTNQFKILVKNYPSIPILAMIFDLGLPKLQWPFGDVINGVFSPKETLSCVTAWGGTNDFHINLHKGIDLDCKSAIPSGYIHAVADGYLYYSGDTKGDLGIAIAIDHGAWASTYYHLEKVLVNLNENEGAVEIKQGQVIGVMGTTGRSTGPHLHLQVFWWPDITTKEKIKNNPYTPSGAILINPNPNYLSVCPGNEKLWINDWSKVEVSDGKGTTFKTCLENDNCFCPGQ